jgi:AraC-like DNA-binding protein
VVPDACTDIVWRTDAGVSVAGPDTEAWTSRTRPGELIVGARLLPGAGGAVLGVPLAELRNARVPLEAIGLEPWVEPAEALDPYASAAALGRLALALIGPARPDPAVQAAVVRLRDSRQRVDNLAASLGFSERQLRRRFLAAVGYGPKTLQRVLRLRRFLAGVGAGIVAGPGGGSPSGPSGWEAGSDGLASAAVAAGYADQAHLARECRALTGLTPRQLAGPGLVPAASDSGPAAGTG